MLVGAAGLGDVFEEDGLGAVDLVGGVEGVRSGGGDDAGCQPGFFCDLTQHGFFGLFALVDVTAGREPHVVFTGPDQERAAVAYEEAGDGEVALHALSPASGGRG